MLVYVVVVLSARYYHIPKVKGFFPICCDNALKA